MDASGSMFGEGLDIAKAAAKAWIDILPLGVSECAITSFNGSSYINQNFTTNKSRLVSAINTLPCDDGTNYNSAMIEQPGGSIMVAKTGKHKRVIVFLTDGMPQSEPNTAKIISEARDADFTVTNITSSNSNFSISPTSFSLNDGQSKELTITYTPVDSGYAFCIFNFVNDRCPEKYYASGGWKGKKLSASTLKLTHPNGGKKFLVGSDTLITWEGVSPDDTVKLEYSTDNGKTWKILTKNTTNLSYIWNKIPKPASNQFIFVALMPKRFLLSLAFRYILWAQGKIKQLSLGLSLRVLARIMQRLS